MASFDRSLSLSFGAVVLALMAVFLTVASVLSFQIQDRRQDFLATALAQSVGESVNRVNSYQMRGLVEELQSRIPGLGYVAVVDVSGHLLAHSRHGLEGKTLTEVGLSIDSRDDVEWEGIHYWQRALPLTGGLADTVVGTILVGVSTDDLRRDQAGFLGSLALLSLAGTLGAVGVILVLSRRFGMRMVAQLDQIIDKSPVGMATADLVTGRIVRVNEQFQTTFQWSRADLPDLTSWFTRAYPDPLVRERVQAEWTQVIGTSQAQGTPIPSFEFQVRCGDGNDRTVLISTALVDHTAVVTFVDRTEQKQAEQDLVNLNLSLEEKVRSRSQELERTYRELAETEKLAALGQLAAGMAHELNTPLGAIQSANGINHEFLNTTLPRALQLLRTLTPAEEAFFEDLTALCQPLGDAIPPLPDRADRRALVETLATWGWDADDDVVEFALEVKLSPEVLVEVATSPRRQQVLRLSRDLLTLSRMTRVVSEGVEKAAHVVDALRRYLNGGDDEVVRFCLKDQIETLLALFHHKIKTGVEVVTNIDETVQVMGDQQRLNQVWMNLIHNALQAMEFKGTLRLTVRRQDEGALIEVADSGPGIPESIQGRIFDAYFTTKKHGEGLGLGLDLCRKILEEHHGTISFRSRPGETVFTVILP